MKPWWSIAGILRVQLVAADPVKIVSNINDAGIVIEQIVFIDPLTIQFNASGRDIRRIKKVINPNEAELSIIHRQGMYWMYRRALARPVLLIGLLMLATLSTYLPSRILFIQVSGNAGVPSKLILEKAEICGIRFGASRREVRSEQVKNALLEQLPQLQWVGINTNGCVATVNVKEKGTAIYELPRSKGINSIVASYDGIILEATVTKGNPLFTVGQAVKAGQKLVSGYTDCGLSICATGAEAEILALTYRSLHVCTPVDSRQRGKLIAVEENSWYQFGKKLYNFNNNSRILDTTCAKIYHRVALTLPGGFGLPIYRITETCYYYELTDGVVENTEDYHWLQDSAYDYLRDQMVAGQVLRVTQNIQLQGDTIEYVADYTCKEMIGKSQTEEIIQ